MGILPMAGLRGASSAEGGVDEKQGVRGGAAPPQKNNPEDRRGCLCGRPLADWGSTLLRMRKTPRVGISLAGPAGRPSPKVEISATVHAPLLGHIVAAMLVASE